MRHGSFGHESGDRGGDLGLSMVVTALSLGATAILTVILLSTMFKSSGSSTTSVTNAPGVEEATALQAQEALSSGLSTVEAAASAGGYGSLNPSALSASGASASFVTGPSSNATTISMAVSTGGGAGFGGAEAGAVTLAARASDNVCWLIWKSAGGEAWYGAQTGLTSCTAPALTVPPSPGPVSSTSIGWQQGSFPPA
jgi:hypothetical protein